MSDNPKEAKAFVELKDFPMPPSQNNLYPTIRTKGGFRRIKSRELENYERDCKMWAIKNAKELSDARLMTLSCGKGIALRVDHLYKFQRSKVLCKNGIPKKRDIFNLQKALHDGLAALLGVDDKFFWAGSIERDFLKHVAFPETVDVYISLIEA